MYKPVFTIEKLAYITKGKLIGDFDKNLQVSLSTDTRLINTGDVYLALCGKVFDGHDFVDRAFEKGAKLAIVDKNHNLATFNKLPLLVVDDTTIAYLQIAEFYKKQQNVKIIAVTGSAGKTTTKEILYCIFSSKFKTQKSLKNHNNEIGLCQTLLAIEPETKYCIVEMGMRALGEIDLLASFAKPDIALITNVGSAHIGILGSLENIAKAKCEIANYLSDRAVLVANENTLIEENLPKGNYQKIFYSFNDIEIIEKNKNSSKFKYNNFVFEFPQNSDYDILNALAAIKIALIEGFSNEEIQKGLLTFKNIEYRNEITKLSNGTIVVSDCYNANPDSVEASIKNVCEIYKNKKIIIVFGDMFELGDFEEFYHKKIGKFINGLNVNYFISIGKLAKISADEISKIPKKIFTKTQEAADFLVNIMDENTLIFLKASRGMKFEQILEIIREK